jgi:hypothetical protein
MTLHFTPLLPGMELPPPKPRPTPMPRIRRQKPDLYAAATARRLGRKRASNPAPPRRYYRL